ncbi:hypothetical protein ACX0G9_27895 [Flavitalea flava]
MDKPEKQEVNSVELIQDLNRSYELQFAEYLTAEELETLLAEKLNMLIRQDFNTLVQLLYRIDINESRLRGLLAENAGEDAGRIMARLIIERQWQKIQTRKKYTPPGPLKEEEEEKW